MGLCMNTLYSHTSWIGPKHITGTQISRQQAFDGQVTRDTESCPDKVADVCIPKVYTPDGQLPSRFYE